jgi:hypothetical protein
MPEDLTATKDSTTDRLASLGLLFIFGSSPIGASVPGSPSIVVFDQNADQHQHETGVEAGAKGSGKPRPLGYSTRTKVCSRLPDSDTA